MKHIIALSSLAPRPLYTVNLVPEIFASETEFDKIFQDFYDSRDVSGNSSAYYGAYEAISRLPDELFSSFISENDSLRNAEWTSKLFTRLSNTTLDIWYGFFYDLDSHYGIDYKMNRFWWSATAGAAHLP